MKKFTAFLLLGLALVACSGKLALADDPAAAPAPALVMTTPAGPVLMPAHPVNPLQAALATMPAWQALPAQHDAGSIIAWVLAFLFPCIGWACSELLPFLPGKANGFLHGFVEMLKTPSYDPQTNSVTVQLDELKAAVNDLKSAATAATPVAAAPPAVPGLEA